MERSEECTVTERAKTFVLYFGIQQVTIRRAALGLW